MGLGDNYSKAQQTEQQVSAGQLSVAQQQQQTSAEDRARMFKLEQPLIAKEQGLLSGDPKAALSAAAPEIGIFAGGFNAAKEQIMQTVPPGPGREYALSQLELQKDTSISSTIAKQVQEAPNILAQIGSGFGGYSLQELGAALSGFGGAGTTSANIAGQSLQAQSNLFNLFGGLAEVAGGIATGGLSTAFGGFGGGGMGGSAGNAIFGPWSAWSSSEAAAGPSAFNPSYGEGGSPNG